MNDTFCAFSGHRAIPGESEGELKQLLWRHIEALAAEGTTGFLCGGALGFDTLAAEAVLSARTRDPAITLTLALPCPEQDRAWGDDARRRFQQIYDSADEVIYVSPAYHRWCMMQRNRFMVDHSRQLICYMTTITGGTAATVRYALKVGVPVINLAAEMS